MSNNDDRAAYDPRLKEIKERFPDARRTGPEDAKSALRSYLILGMIFLIIGIMTFILSVSMGDKAKDFFSHAETVEGSVISVESRKVGSPKYKNTVYRVLYTYTYDNIDYHDSETISPYDAGRLGLSTGDVSGKSVTVYVDVRDPQTTRIVYTEGTPMYFLLIFCVIGIVLIVLGIKMYKRCKEGNAIVYHVGRYVKYLNTGKKR